MSNDEINQNDINMDESIHSYNKIIIINALKECGATYAEVTYEGSGDSGGIDSIDTDVEEDILEKKMVEIKSNVSSYNGKTSEWESSIGFKSLSLNDALTEMCSTLVSDYHSGYENNDGGGGTLKFLLDSNAFELEHYERIVTEEYSTSRG